MQKRIDERIKESSVENMINNMTVLRTMMHLSQAELAELIGMGRQNLAAIENRKRRMTWSTFLSLLFVFSQNSETNELLEILGVYSQELKSVYTDNKKNNKNEWCRGEYGNNSSTYAREQYISP